MPSLQAAHILEVIFIPCLLLGLACGLLWRLTSKGKIQTGIQIVGSLLFFVPIPFVLFLAEYSAAVLFYQRIILALIGYLMTALILFKLHVRRNADRFDKRIHSTSADPYSPVALVERLRMQTLASRHQNARKLYLALIFSVGLSGLATWYLVGDYLLPRRIVEGTTGEAVFHHGSRAPGYYELEINSGQYRITLDQLVKLHPGEHVRAQVGRGSNTILHIDVL